MWKFPYPFASCIILKKSGLMMKHFNIDSRYPYIRKSFIDDQFSVVNIFSIRKMIHKRFVTETVNKNIASHMQKHGGSTDAPAVMNDGILAEIEKLVHGSRWYDPKSIMRKRIPLDYNLRILYVEIFGKMFQRESDNGYPSLEELFPEFQKTQCK